MCYGTLRVVHKFHLISLDHFCILYFNFVPYGTVFCILIFWQSLAEYTEFDVSQSHNIEWRCVLLLCDYRLYSILE